MTIWMMLLCKNRKRFQYAFLSWIENQLKIKSNSFRSIENENCSGADWAMQLLQRPYKNKNLLIREISS